METKQTFFLLLIAASLFSIPAISVSASSSSDEDEEEEENGEAAAPAAPTPPPPTPPVSQGGQQQLPSSTADAEGPTTTAPTQPNTTTPSQATSTTGGGVTAQDLITKYGANRTIALEATGQVFGPGGALENVTGDRAVVITFDDNWKSQHDFAAPILENNDYNATYFVYCLGVDQGPAFMTSDMVRDLNQRGFDIESHSMTHPDLEHVSADDLAFEVGTSKQCLQDMVPGLNVSIFATPFATGSENATVLQEIADAGYEFARVGYGSSFNIQCAATWYVPLNQSAGCEMRDPQTNELKFQNHFNLPTLDVNALSRQNNHDLNATQAQFEELVTSTLDYDNQTGRLLSIPILVYHNQTDQILPEMGQSMLAESFAQQMQWLKDNGFFGLSMKDLVYNPENATFTIPTLDKLGYTNATATATTAQAVPTA